MNATEPLPTTINTMLSQADCIVVVATPRYVQKDFHKMQAAGNGISKMLHVETGIAHGKNLPIITIVQKGTDVGTFLKGQRNMLN